MKAYIKIDENNKIISCDTNKFGNLISVDIDEELFNSMKILSCSYIDGEVVYDEVTRNEQFKAAEKAKSIRNLLLNLMK